MSPFLLKAGETDRQTSHMARCVTFAVARIRVKGLPLEIGEICIFLPLAPKVREIGDPKRLTRVRGQVYTCRPNLVVIDQSWWAVGRGMTGRHPDRQTDKQNGMTIRLTLCERDATDRHVGLATGLYQQPLTLNSERRGL